MDGILTPSNQSDELVRFARRACNQCQNRKRRCGKELPECGLCTRMRRPCEYRDENETTVPTAEEEPNVLQQSIELASNFPAAYFLDPQVFQYFNMEIRIPRFPLPQELSDSANMARDVSGQYFETVHSWLPILSRIKFYGQLFQQQSSQLDVDLAFLVMCMQLILCRSPVSDNNNRMQLPPLYTRVKRYFVDLEIAGIFNITVMQAVIMIAMYELGHGIYPAAHLTIGTCARYGVALGLDKEVSEWEHISTRWVGYEEKHRAWWAIIILDRFLSVSSPNRALCTNNPGENTYIPVQDEEWNHGKLSSTPPYKVTAPSQLKMGKFARMAQATYLLGRVLQHVSDTKVDQQFWREEEMLLEKTLQSLLSLTVAEEEMSQIYYCTPVAITASALLVLHSHHREDYPDSRTNVENRRQSISSLEETSRITVSVTEKFLRASQTQVDNVSPLLQDWIYRSAAVFIQLQQDRRISDDYLTCEQILRQVLVRLSSRWTVGNIYLELLDARKLSNGNLDI